MLAMIELAQHGVVVDWFREYFDDLVKVFLIDITLAGDNAIVVGLAASQVAPEKRAKVIFWGITAAVVLRVLFASVALKMLAIIGLTLAGGLLLLWVCWKMYRQIAGGEEHDIDEIDRKVASGSISGKELGFWTAVSQITIADVSMSLDNVLAVAGAAQKSNSVIVLWVGLGLAIALMAVASHFIARLLVRYPWISWIGLAVIVWVALDMIYRGSHEVFCQAVNVGCSETLLDAIKHRLKLWSGMGG